MMRLKFAIWMGLGLYALLSVTDWVMTFALLRLHPGAVEANPFAAACLERYGWNGLALYKAGGVLIFTGAVFLLISRRPKIAGGLVALGCAVLLWVTTYTHSLICAAHRDAADRAADVAWPKAKQATRQPEAAVKVPDQCWFAPAPPAPVPATASLR